MIGITFDFWDTLAHDDSDEPKRAARGLPPKVVAREQLVTTSLMAAAPGLDPAAARAAWSAALERFRHCWKVEHHTPTVATRLRWACEHAGLSTPPDFDAVVHALETMEVELPPDPIAGIGEALGALADRHPLGIISDTIVTPGRGLREILRGWGLHDLFSTFVFSDEVGAAKPAPAVFEAAAAGLGVPLHRLVHVGDRESNDIAGPHGVGARALLCTASVDRGAATSRADGIFGSYGELGALIDTLS